MIRGWWEYTSMIIRGLPTFSSSIIWSETGNHTAILIERKILQNIQMIAGNILIVQF